MIFDIIALCGGVGVIGSIEALQADRDALLDICEHLDEVSWALPSGCPGGPCRTWWPRHVGGLYWMVVDLTVLPDTAGLPTEEAQEVIVALAGSGTRDRYSRATAR